ncbi:hypothetical protein BJ973_000457 [Actinoplanes tereljensis]|uniref:CATRA-Associated Small Protein domain-containing protein n=1 Tax=Paractinoplanes tereljensis TaxID=571912 RepID=A0A919NTC9_9ACTN|nr:CATRA system-associated protein [Actinoplanes tereljensis]GIF23187.1 hypothetical protein Ate02nite_59170 [Actinoplanes tereljensis]
MDLPGSWDYETVQDAVDVLQDLVLWEMSTQRWEHVAAILGRIDAALGARDADELRQAVAELEISGPVRILRIGGKTVTGVPQPVLDLRNTLVHKLTPERRNAPEDDRGRQQPR